MIERLSEPGVSVESFPASALRLRMSNPSRVMGWQGYSAQGWTGRGDDNVGRRKWHSSGLLQLVRSSVVGYAGLGVGARAGLQGCPQIGGTFHLVLPGSGVYVTPRGASSLVPLGLRSPHSSPWMYRSPILQVRTLCEEASG